MRVEVVSYVRFQDGGRERELMPGQTCDLPDALGKAWAEKGLVRVLPAVKKGKGEA